MYTVLAGINLVISEVCNFATFFKINATFATFFKNKCNFLIFLVQQKVALVMIKANANQKFSLRQIVMNYKRLVILGRIPANVHEADT